MIEITQADFNDWKSNKVTKAFLHAAQERAEDCKEILATSAGLDILQDRFLRELSNTF